MLTLGVEAGGSDRTPALDHLARELGACGVALESAPGETAAVRVRLNSSVEHPQGYRLGIEPQGVTIEGADLVGLDYGIRTLAQLVATRPDGDQEDHQIDCLLIEDWPDLLHRGVLLDISRTRVPTMETLYGLVELLASWKVNQLQLYTEHTFAYRGHEAVWEGASPMTADEVRALDTYCRARHLELVPNQNSFGHMHRWLRHEPYRRLAECPDGIEHPFSAVVEPFSLCPTDPAALDLLADLYDQLLPCFSSRQLHVGLDETFDLGRGRSREEVSRRGPGPVYAGFLRQIHRLVQERGRRMQFWGDIVGKHPEMIEELPKDAIAMVWGYESGHPFTEEVQRLRDRGLEAYTCPGTSSWLSFAGRLHNAVENISQAVEAAVDGGGTGCLVTDWGDRGHLQPLPVSYPGFLVAASVSWNAGEAMRPEGLKLESLLVRHAFADDDPVIAQTLLEMASLYRATGARFFNGSPLFHLVTSPDLPLHERRFEGLRQERLADCGRRIERVRSSLSGLDSLAGRELGWVAECLETGIEIGILRLRAGGAGATSEIPVVDRAAIVERLDRLLDGHRSLWPERSRPGGLEESLGFLVRARRIWKRS